ncbi:hypothetical protein Tco_0907474 [Tanacetum coccineum]|uniref:Uncharacterized protein n=1 Tax=Tanacetum coccineum TaxID=301880 RepID=A0ABQ5CKG5_9ASTR
MTILARHTNCLSKYEKLPLVLRPTSTFDSSASVKDTKIAALRLKFNAFKALEGEKVQGTYTRLEILLNGLENKGVSIPQDEVNATFVNSLLRKWLETSRFSIQAPSSKALISKTHLKDSNSDVEEDTRSSSEFLADLNAEFHDKALLANKK